LIASDSSHKASSPRRGGGGGGGGGGGMRVRQREERQGQEALREGRSVWCGGDSEVRVGKSGKSGTLCERERWRERLPS